MKKIIFVIVLFVGCKHGIKTDQQFHRELWQDYNDSFDKYINIRTDCGNELREYYFKKGREEYKLMYHNSNPVDKYTIDTICYPIKTNP